MIFSRLLNKKKWQHKDSNIRVIAVQNDLSVIENKATLLSLLTDDDSENVRRAVLVKFNDFSLWLLASEKNTHKNIRAFAQREVEAILKSKRDIHLSTNEKLSFISTHNKTSLFESWLSIEDEADVALALYKKIAKPQLALRIFKDKPFHSVQQYIVESTNVIAELEKLLKKSTLSGISALIVEKIALITEKLEQPKIITKQTQLVLSKLLALKDLTQYQIYIEKRGELEKQWQKISNDFSLLPAADSENFLAKYQKIAQQLTHIFAGKAEAFEQQKIANELTLKKQTLAADFETQINALEQCISDSIFETNRIDEAVFLQQITTSKKDIVNSILEDRQKHHFLTQLQQVESKLSQLPDIAESLTQATHLISKMSQSALPDNLEHLIERENDYKDWLKQWKMVERKASGFLPDSIVDSYQEITKQWTLALKPLHKKQSHQLKQMQRLFSDFNRLVNTGKYNAVFGVFKRMTQCYQQLSEAQQQKVQREFGVAQEKVTELSDWEHYIATPRKKSLLEELQQLIQQPLDNPIEQANKVKAYRKLWNSLGHADDDIEKALNEAFNQACEIAFAPCRLFYAEQEKIRAQHLVKRQSLIEAAKSLALVLEEDSIDWKNVDANLNKLKQKWRNAGDIERDQYRKINDEFSQLIKPVQFAVLQQQKNNCDEKQRLIQATEKLLTEEDILKAINESKSIQAKWRHIGFSGVRDENKLWQKFRQTNDKIFARRDELKQSQKEQQSLLLAQYNAAIDKIEHSIKDKSAVKLLTAAIYDLTQLHTDVTHETITLNPINHRVDKLTRQLEADVIQLRKAENSQIWKNIFQVLEESMSQGVEKSVVFESLPKSWQKKLMQIPSHECERQLRLNKTIALEIMSGIESPQADKTARLAIQVELMQQQMTSDEVFNIEEGFMQWLYLGRISTQDNDLIERMKIMLIK